MCRNRLVMAIPLLFAACTGVQPSAMTQEDTAAAVSMEACPATRWVAELDSATSCATQATMATGWRAEKLFPATGGVLDRFCLYTRDDEPGQQALQAVRQVSSVVSRDCNVISMQSTPSSTADLARLEAEYRRAIQALDPLPPLPGSSSPVPVSVIDTALDRNPGDHRPGAGNSPHGYAVANAIAHLACPRNSTCLVHVVNALGLQLVKTPTGYDRPPGGGYFGSIADVARVTVQQSLAVLPGEPHILNFSIGFHPDFGNAGEAEPGDFAASVRALFGALQLARCRGNLILAAAGNTAGERSPALGPLAPGLWEQQPAPSRVRCQHLGVADIRTEEGQPLLFAFAGVTRDDAPLYNTRRGARPRLAAPAEQVYFADYAGQARTHAPYTGSSFAAAVGSAAAGIVWAYRPGLTPAGVIEFLAQTGVPLGYSAEFCLNPPCGNVVTRLSLCRAAIAASCRDSDPLCNPERLCPEDAPGPGFEMPVGWQMDGSAVATTVADPGETGVLPDLCSDADAELNTSNVPWAGGQPGDPICLTCKLSLSGTSPRNLTINTHPEYAGSQFVADRLYVHDSGGEHCISLTGLFPEPMTGGVSYEATVNTDGMTGLPPAGEPSVPTMIYFTFVTTPPPDYNEKLETVILELGAASGPGARKDAMPRQ